MGALQTGVVGNTVTITVVETLADGTQAPMDYTTAMSVKVAVQDPVTGLTTLVPATIMVPAINVVQIVSTATTFRNPGTYRVEVIATFPDGSTPHSNIGLVTVYKSLT